VGDVWYYCIGVREGGKVYDHSVFFWWGWGWSWGVVIMCWVGIGYKYRALVEFFLARVGGRSFSSVRASVFSSQFFFFISSILWKLC